MIGTREEMRALAHELETSTWTLAALGVLFESGLVDHLTDARSLDDLASRCSGLSRSRIERCLAVLGAAGVVVVEGARYQLAAGAAPFAQGLARSALAGEVRSALMQPLALLDSAGGDRAVTGWRHTDPALLQAQGEASGGFPPMFKANIVPSLGDLGERLDRPGARFLDVGVGVAALAISMCRVWPEIRVVGLDTFEVPLAIARQNVARANLTDRIELRQVAIEDLADEGSFDLAWLPGVFIPALAAAVAHVRASLRPGGWMLLPIVGNAGDDRQRAVWLLVNDLYGGPVLTVAEAESLLKGSGLSSVRTVAGPAWAPTLVMGQR